MREEDLTTFVLGLPAVDSDDQARLSAGQDGALALMSA